MMKKTPKRYHEKKTPIHSRKNVTSYLPTRFTFMIDNPKHSYQIVFGKISKYYHNLKKVLVAAHIDPIHVT